MDVWMIASRSYHQLLRNVRRSLEVAGEPACVYTRWFRDIRDVTGSHWSLGLDSFAYSFRRFLSIAEAFLVASMRSQPATREGEAPLLAIMDLDVQVFPGWSQALRSCLSGPRAADACFPQQPPHPTEDANGGIWALRGDRQPALALMQSTLARLQGLEVLLRMFPEQPINCVDQPTVNAILHQVRRHRGQKSLRWGIYHPESVPVRGVAQGLKPSRVFLHHATGAINLQQKVEVLERVAVAVRLAGELCRRPPASCMVGRGGHCPALAESGPLLPICLFLLPTDPHFGEPFESYRIYGGFTQQRTMMDHRIFQQTKIQGLASDLASRPEAAAISDLLQEG